MPTYEPAFVKQCMEFRAPAFRTTNEGCPAPPTNLVLRFLDSHLDDKLILKRVIRVPDLVSKLSVVADENVAKLNLNGINKAIVGLGYGTYRDTTSIVKASDVAYEQTEGISLPCLQLASSLFMHPQKPLHQSIFDWFQLPALNPDWDEKEPHGFVVQDNALGISDRIPDFPRALPPEILLELETMRRCYPLLSLGVFFSPAAHDVLQDIGSLGDAESFPWQMSSRCTGKARKVPVYSKAGTISSVPRISAGHQTAHYFQRAWVNVDATTIIFDCGRSLRIGIRSRRFDAYVQKEYLSVILDVRIAEGATGTVFIGRLGPNTCLPRGKTDFPFVVKVATPSAKLVRLRREHAIYMHLHSAKVNGIPPVFGYFEDVDQEAGALVLANVCLPLGKRIKISQGTQKLELLSEMSDQLREAVNGIHDAGVLHGDIRSWNILLDSDERIWIIDFDSASLEGSERAYVAESERLERFIKGQYIDGDPVLVPHRRSSHSDSSEDPSASQPGDESSLE